MLPGFYVCMIFIFVLNLFVCAAQCTDTVCARLKLKPNLV